MDFEKALQIAKESANTATPLPQYQCHKKVWALKIIEVVKAPLPTIAELERILDGDNEAAIGGFIVPERPFAPIPVSAEWLSKHAPEAGGYLVFYEDGYRSYSPAKAFEDGYTRI